MLLHAGETDKANLGIRHVSVSERHRHPPHGIRGFQAVRHKRTRHCLQGIDVGGVFSWRGPVVGQAKVICQEEQKAVDKLEIIDGAKDVLNYFKGQQIMMGIVTMQCRQAFQKIQNKIDELSVFSNVITRDESYDREEQIKKTIEKFGLQANEVMMIGDRIHDAESAIRAGCNSILVG